MFGCMYVYVCVFYGRECVYVLTILCCILGDKNTCFLVNILIKVIGCAKRS